MNRFSIFIFGLLAVSQLTCGGPPGIVWESQILPPPSETSSEASSETSSEASENTSTPDVAATPPAVCGDGVVDMSAEQCDDGNTAEGDCCSSTCQFEAGGSVCNDNNSCTFIDQCDGAGLCAGNGSTCGNSLLEDGCGEQCDDSNLLNADGCNDTCQNEICGDGSVNNNGAEQCDDGNRVDGDSCNSACQNEICGDGVVNNGGVEQCDDGNTESGDGCQANCLLPVCGDNVLDDGEVCDDGNTDSGDGCNDVCIPECPGDPSRTVFAGGPGNGACQAFEDDQSSCEEAYHLGGGGVASCYFDEDDEWCYGCGANNENSGNCVNTCRVPICGDGFLSLGEDCDDGNTDGEDGCEPDCTLSLE